MIIGAQIRGARAILRWSAEDLARRAGVGPATVRRAEAEDGAPNMLSRNMIALQEALEMGGIEFTNESAPGLRIRPDLILETKDGLRYAIDIKKNKVGL